MKLFIEIEILKYGVERVWVVRGIRNVIFKIKEMFEEVKEKIFFVDDGYIVINFENDFIKVIDNGVKVKIIVSKFFFKRFEGLKIMEYVKKGKFEFRVFDKFEFLMFICDDEVFFVFEDMVVRYFNYEI